MGYASLEDKKAHNRAYYGSHKEQWERYYTPREMRRRWLRGIKSFLGCFVCGEDSAHRLVFHHLNEEDKRDDVSTMMINRKDMAPSLAELKRCIVLCHNCHADVHYGPQAA